MHKGKPEFVSMPMQVVSFTEDQDVFRDVMLISKEDYYTLANQIQLFGSSSSSTASLPSTLVAHFVRPTAVPGSLKKLDVSFCYLVEASQQAPSGTITMSMHQRSTLGIGKPPVPPVDVIFIALPRVEFAPIKTVGMTLNLLPMRRSSGGTIYVREDKLQELVLSSLDGHLLNVGQYIPVMYEDVCLVANVTNITYQQSKFEDAKEEIVSDKSSTRLKKPPSPAPSSVVLRSSAGFKLGQLQSALRPYIAFATRATDTRLQLGLGPKSRGSQMSNVPLNFKGLGVGGLDKELAELVQTAFITRHMTVESLGCYGVKHSKGILLYGPPGTGKTLIARTIANMFQHKKVKEVNGPEIFGSLVGESEERVRALFKEAEAEYALKGDESDLHVIIFDEIDSICKKRGTRTGDTGVGDAVVNQLLTKIDGMNALNNILLIGMTNRIDMLDEALLRSGRMDCHIRIGLPDLDGRYDILKIHTRSLKRHKKLDASVNIRHWAEATVNFSGADLANLVVRAVQNALPRNFETKDNKLVMKDIPLEQLTKVTEEDFKAAFEKVSPAYGVAIKKINPYISRKNLLPFNEDSKRIMNVVRTYVDTLKNTEDCPTLSLLLSGGQGVGKTTLAMELAVRTGAPFIAVIGAGELAGMTDRDRINYLDTEFDKASQSNFSVIVLDNVEGILGASPDGRSYSNPTLLKLQHLLKTPPKTKLLVIATGSDLDFLSYIRLLGTFKRHEELSPLARVSEVYALVKHLRLLPSPSDGDGKEDPKDKLKEPQKDGVLEEISSAEKESYKRLLLKERPIGDVMLALKIFLATNAKAPEKIDFEHFLHRLEE